MPLFLATLLVSFLHTHVAMAADTPDLLTFKENGGWCWFQDDRAIIDEEANKLVFSTVASKAGKDGDEKGGNVEVTSYDFSSGDVKHAVLHANLESDDHNSAALFKLEDGRYVAAYARHDTDTFSRNKISKKPADISNWQNEQTYTHSDKVTYNHLLNLKGRLWNITRTKGIDPHFIYSDDQGESWQKGGRILDSEGRPYLKYVSNGDRIFLVASNRHPRKYANNIFIGYIQNGKLFNMNGVIDDNLYDDEAVSVEKLTPIYLSRGKTTGWPVDIELDDKGNPIIIFSVRKIDSEADLGKEDAAALLGYFYAFVKPTPEGTMMVAIPMAFAGTPLYAYETDYAGLATINPNNTKQVYISTNVDPVTSKPLISSKDGKQHYEIFEGKLQKDERKWIWSPVTEHSDADNIRPTIPRSESGKHVLLWLKGKYTNYFEYDLDVVGHIYPN